MSLVSRREVNLTEDSRKALLEELGKIDPPAGLVLVVLIESGIRVRDVFCLGREALEVHPGEAVPYLRQGKISYWMPTEAAREVLERLLEYGGWEKLQDILGRDYQAAYLEARVLLRTACRNVNLDPVKLGSFRFI